MIVQASIAILYFAPNLMLDDFQFSIFFNRLVYGLMTLISTVSCYCFIQKFKRKYYAFGCFIITLVWSLVLVFVYRLKSEGEEISILTMTANFLAILAITFAMTT